MKKKLLLLIATLATGFGYHLYNKNKKESSIEIDERNLARDNNDFTVYHDDDLPNKNGGEEMFV